MDPVAVIAFFYVRVKSVVPNEEAVYVNLTQNLL